MNVFIAWAGDTSKQIALALRNWLPKAIHTIKPWMSEEDIEKGKRWDPEIDKALEVTNFGIVCLTPDNLESTWVHYEAGALAKSVEESLIWTYLYGLDKSEVRHPLAKFQHTLATEKDSRKLLGSINHCLDVSIAEGDLNEIFDTWWPKLADRFENIPTHTKRRVEKKRSIDDILEEVLDTVRVLERNMRKESLSRRETELLLIEDERELNKLKSEYLKIVDAMEKTEKEDEKKELELNLRLTEGRIYALQSHLDKMIRSSTSYFRRLRKYRP